MGVSAPSRGRLARAIVTFDGAAGTGATGAVTIFTVTGRIAVDQISVFCTTGLTTTTTGSISLGTTTNVARFLALLAATAGDHPIDTNEWWASGTPTAGSIDTTSASGGATDLSGILVSENVIFDITVADFTAGVLEVYMRYEPLSANAAVTTAWPTQ